MTRETASERPAPVYRKPPEKVRDEQVRRPLPGVVVDTLFFILATLGAAWLAVRLLQDAFDYR